MAYPRYQLARAHRFVTRTSGNLPLNSTAAADLDTGLDLTLEAQVGDTIEVGLSGYYSSEAVNAHLDAVSLVAGAPVNSWANQGAAPATVGVPAWSGIGGADSSVGGSVMKTIEAGDLASGELTIRFRYLTSAAAVKTLRATLAQPLQVWAKNLGPSDPE